MKLAIILNATFKTFSTMKTTSAHLTLWHYMGFRNVIVFFLFRDSYTCTRTPTFIVRVCNHVCTIYIYFVRQIENHQRIEWNEIGIGIGFGMGIGWICFWCVLWRLWHQSHELNLPNVYSCSAKLRVIGQSVNCKMPVRVCVCMCANYKRNGGQLCGNCYMFMTSILGFEKKNEKKNPFHFNSMQTNQSENWQQQQPLKTNN